MEAPARPDAPAPGRVLDALADRQLVVVTGKGGVGKTAVAAALGSLLARRRRVLVLEVDPRENLHQMLGRPPSGGEVTAAGGDLWLQNLKPREVVDRLVVERLRLDVLARRVLASAVYQQFAEGAPGLKEVAVLGHALRLVRGLERGPWGDRFDLVVLDAPATGHGVSLLAAPRLLAEVVARGPVGELGAELAAFVADPGRTAVVAVTTPEEMPVQEVLELAASLEERTGRRPDLLVVNGLYPPLPGPAAAGGEVAVPWADRRRTQDREMARLDASWPGPRLLLPELPLEPGPALVARLARCLAAGAEAAWS